MGVEALPTSEETKTERKQPHIFFMAGARGAYDGLKTIQGELSGAFGTEHVSVYNSILSKDVNSSDRFRTIGQAFKKRIEQGPTTIVAHSFGTAETVAAFDEIEKTDPDFFKKKENIDNLNLILISPAGFFENWRQGLKYLTKYGRLGVQEAGMLGMTLPGKTSVLHGIVSASTVPSHEMDRNIFAGRIKKVTPKTSQADGSVKEIVTDVVRDYSSALDTTTYNAVRAIDRTFAETTANEHLTFLQKMAARKALRQRGRLTTKVVNGALQNAYTDEPGVPHKSYDKSIGLLSYKSKIIKDTFFKGRVMERMTALQNAGAKINIVIPEHDTLLSVREARKFLGNHWDRLRVANLATHMAPWSPQPRSVVDAIKAFETAA